MAFQKTCTSKESPSAGCTAIVAILRGHDLYIANLGDARAVVCQNGKAIALSRDHKPTRLDEKKRIENAGGKVLYGRVQGFLGVSRAFGDFEFKSCM